MFKIARKTVRTVRTRPGRALLHSAAALLALAAISTPASARPFQQYLNGVCGPSLCRINFAVVPVGQQLLVKNASCYVRPNVDPGSLEAHVRAVQMLVLGANPANTASAVTLVPELVSKTSSEAVFSANHAISGFAQARQRFQAYVQISAGTFSQVACHISGDMVKA